MKKCMVFFLLASLTRAVFASSGIVHRNSPTASDILNRRSPGLRLVNLTAVEALTEALEEFGVTGGAVALAGDGNERKLTIRPANDTLRAVLQGIVAAEPRYRWAVDNGAVNLLPRKTAPALLDVFIPTFNSMDANNVPSATSILLGLPAIREAAHRLGIDRVEINTGMLAGVPLPGAETPKPPKPLAAHCKNVTLRQALNSIVKANGKGVWIYEEWHAAGRGGFRVTLVGLR